MIHARRRKSATPPTLDQQVALQERVLRGSNARQLHEFVSEVVVHEEEARVRKRIFEKLDSGQALDPTEAVQAWLEIRAAHRLVSNLRRIKVDGEAASRQLTDSVQKSE